MPTLHLVQYLCPARHALAALLYAPRVCPARRAEARLAAQLVAARANPWCGICGSSTLHFEHAPTPWRTWEEAEQALDALARANAQTRALLDAAGLTDAARRWRQN
jgi:hypothetical protein